MTEQTSETPAPNPDDKGLPPGIAASFTGEGDRGTGAPKAPVVNNTAPVKEQTAEEKAIADKAAADAAAAEVPAVPPAEAVKEPVDEVGTEYPDYGDTNANAVVNVLKEANIPVADAHALFKDAVETGDFSKVNVSMLVEKLGQAKADLVLLGVKAYYDTFTQSTKETVTAAYEAVGGEANYKKVQTWAKAQAAKDPAFLARMEGLNQMFDLNKTAAVMAARELASLYEKDSNNSSLTLKQVHGERAVTTNDSTSEHLSRADYLAQVKEAHAKNDMHAVNRLRAQRAASLPIKQ